MHTDLDIHNHIHVTINHILAQHEVDYFSETGYRLWGICLRREPINVTVPVALCRLAGAGGSPVQCGIMHHDHFAVFGQPDIYAG